MVVSELIDRYLDGAATQEQVRQLDELLRQDAAARESLFSAASFEVHLRRCLVVESATEPSTNPPFSGPRARSAWWKTFARYAAVLFIAASGWAATAFYADKYRQGQDELAAARAAADNIAALGVEWKPGGQPDMPKPHPLRGGRIIETRGSVWAMPTAGQPALTLTAGSAIPGDRAMYTCPWGGATMKFADGAWMRLDRNSMAALSEEDGRRHVVVKKGIFYATQHADKPGDVLAVTTRQATLEVLDAEAAVAVEGGRTIVEVSRGSVRVTRTSDGQQITVPVGHYVIVGEAELRSIKGSMAFHIEPGTPNADWPSDVPRS